jgi:hypothetical protein
MSFVATCIIAPKKGVTSAGILNTIDSKALEEFSIEKDEGNTDKNLQCTLPEFFVILVNDTENARNNSP